MRPKNGRLVIVVAAVAVAAVAVGGVLAYRQGPRSGGQAAAPLVADSTTGPGSTSAGAAPYTGSAYVALKLSKLPTGRAPQIPYMIGREVRGGAGTPVKLPGTQAVLEIARLGEEVLAVVETPGGGTSELLKVSSVGKVERVPDVINVVTTEDETAAAYSVQPTVKGATVAGGAIYAQSAADSLVQKLSLSKVWQPRVLAYTKGKVFFRAGSGPDSAAWSLYSWTPGAAQATEVKDIQSPTAVNRDATLVGSRTVAAEFAACSTVDEVATGKQLWRTCDYGVEGFTPDGTVAIAGPPYADGYAAVHATALDARSGHLLREWSGASFIETFVEDDQHLLIIVDDGPETRRGIIRCTLPTGNCELAVPLTTEPVELGK
jgi:hypothetical protein